MEEIELNLQNQQKKPLESPEDCPQQKTLDIIWQEMHLIMSKLTSTRRKTQYMRRSLSKQRSLSDNFQP